MQHRHKQQIQHHVQNAGHHQKEHGTLGIAHGTQDARAHVIDHRTNGTGKVNAQVGGGIGHAVFRCPHPPHHPATEADSNRRKHDTQQQRQRHTGMDGIRHTLAVPRPVGLGKHHGGTGTDTDKKAVDHAHQRAGGPHRCQRFGAHQTANDDGIHRVVHLLEKCSHQDGKKENQQLFPNHTLGNLLPCACFHCFKVPLLFSPGFYHVLFQMSILNYATHFYTNTSLPLPAR